MVLNIKMQMCLRKDAEKGNYKCMCLPAAGDTAPESDGNGEVYYSEPSRIVLFCHDSDISAEYIFLWDDLHKVQKHSNCLDYLLYQMDKIRCSFKVPENAA